LNFNYFLSIFFKFIHSLCQQECLKYASKMERNIFSSFYRYLSRYLSLLHFLSFLFVFSSLSHLCNLYSSLLSSLCNLSFLISLPYFLFLSLCFYFFCLFFNTYLPSLTISTSILFNPSLSFFSIPSLFCSSLLCIFYACLLCFLYSFIQPPLSSFFSPSLLFSLTSFLFPLPSLPFPSHSFLFFSLPSTLSKLTRLFLSLFPSLFSSITLFSLPPLSYLSCIFSFISNDSQHILLLLLTSICFLSTSSISHSICVFLSLSNSFFLLSLFICIEPENETKFSLESTESAKM